MEQRHLLLTLRFCGTAYHGFQVQKNAVTVAQVVQDAIERIFGERLDVKGCSRTDAGVHANRFALTVRTESRIACDALIRAMNVNLPPDVAVTACREVPQDFHPRYSCTGKRYIYKIYNHPVRDPFLEGLVLHHPHILNVACMDEAARQFVGTHDFTSFCSAGSSVKDTVRTIMQASVVRQGDLVVFSVTGNGFLYNMVRIMMGTLMDVSRGVYSPGDIPAILSAKNRAAAGVTAPPHGLYLDEVFYND